MFTIIETTTNDIENAKLISSTILDNKLSPCVQIHNSIKSYYRWENTIKNDNEYLLRIKTINKYINTITQLINKVHKYDTPELISYNINIESSNYEKWFIDNIK